MYINSQYYEAYREVSDQIANAGAIVRWCGYYQCDGRYKLRRVHERYFIIYIVKGSGVFFDQSNEKSELQPGDVLVYKPFEFQNFVASKEDPMTYAGLVFSGRFFDEYLKDSYLLTHQKTFIGINHDLVFSLRNLISEMLTMPEDRDDYIFAKAMEIISTFNYMVKQIRLEKDATCTGRKRIDKVADYIAENCTEKISLDAIANQAGWSKSWTQTLFKRYYNMSPIEFQIHARIEKAKMMIASNEMSIGEISCSLGFSDQFYLSKMFKRYTGLSPKEYRNAVNKI